LFRAYCGFQAEILDAGVRVDYYFWK